MRGGLSSYAMCIVGWSLLKRPFSLPRTNLQGDISSPLGVKAKKMLQELHSLGGGTITHRASLGRGCFSHLSTLSLVPYPKEKDSIASSFHAKQLLPPRPSTSVLGKRGGSTARAETLFSPPPTWLAAGRHPSLQAVLWPTLCPEQESRGSCSCLLPGTAVRCASTAHHYICFVTP